MYLAATTWPGGHGRGHRPQTPQASGAVAHVNEMILVGLLVMRAFVGRSVREHAAQIGLKRRTIVTADDGRIGAPTLRSASRRLVATMKEMRSILRLPPGAR